MQFTRKFALLVLAVLVALAVCTSAQTRFVNVQLASGNDDGTSWANAYRTVDGVARALDAATSGEIWVARGTYRPTSGSNRMQSMILRRGIRLYGGFDGTESSLAQRDVVNNVTVLSGDLALDDALMNFADNSLHVVLIRNTQAGVRLDGFTIEGGNADVASPPHGNTDGGGGVLVEQQAGALVVQCTFRGNRALHAGGAVHVDGGNSEIRSCRFENNTSTAYGGAVAVEWGTTTIDRCEFSGNTAAAGGGLILLNLSAVHVTNSLFVANVASGITGGGAIGLTNHHSPVVTNCTVVGNSAPNGTVGGIRITGPTRVANCIVWGNSGAGGASGSANQIGPAASTTVLNSCVSGGFPGSGNLSVDPRFENPGTMDFHLVYGSPCIDAGKHDELPMTATVDLDGRARRSDEPSIGDTGVGPAPQVDLGAFERQGPIVSTICPGDSVSAAACPCGNSTLFGNDEGCLNSLGMGGKLEWTGNAGVSHSTLVLRASQMPNSSTHFFQGTSVPSGSGIAFGDGILCAGGVVVRIGSRANVAGSAAYPGPSDPTIAMRGQITAPGSVRVYQALYRNSMSFCSPQGFNFTNALLVTWGD